MNRVAIYVRLSDEDRDKRSITDESESIQNQKSMLLTYAIEKGWDVYKIYCDEDYSGVDKNRPEWNELIVDAENGKFDIVLCKTQSRFSRDMEMVEKYIHGKFLEWDIRFVSIVDHADTSIVGNKKARQINGLINEWYLEDLSDNIRRTLNHKKAKGEWVGSFAPYGYMRDPNNKSHLVIDEEAAEIVRQIFSMFLNGLGYQLIAKELNNRGIPNPTNYKKGKGINYANHGKICPRVTGSIWTTDTIYYILRKEEYVGSLCQNKTENISYKNKKRKINDKKRWTKAINAHEAIIDKEIWERTQAKLSTRTRPEKKTGEKHIFSGKVFCDVCKNVLTKKDAPESKGSFRYLKCRTYNNSPESCDNKKSIRFDLLENIVLDEVNGILNEYYNPENVQIEDTAEQNKINKLLKEKDALIIQIEKKNKVIESLYFDKVEGLITSEQFVKFKKTSQDEIDKFNTRIEQINKQIEINQSGEAEGNLKKEIIKKYTNVDKLNHEIVNEFINSIYIGKDISKSTPRELRIIWNF